MRRCVVIGISSFPAAVGTTLGGLCARAVAWRNAAFGQLRALLAPWHRGATRRHRRDDRSRYAPHSAGAADRCSTPGTAGCPRPPDPSSFVPRRRDGIAWGRPRSPRTAGLRPALRHGGRRCDRGPATPVNIVAAHHRQQHVTQRGVLASFARRVERLVQQHDGPRLPIAAQYLVQPLCLCLGGARSSADVPSTTATRTPCASNQ